MMSYDSIMGRTTDSLIGPQPVTLELKNLDKPQPGTISILEGYTVTDKADGDRAQVFVTDGKAYLIESSERHDRRCGMRRETRKVLFWTVSSSLRHRTIYPRVCTLYSTLRCPATWLLAYLFSQDRGDDRQGGEEALDMLKTTLIDTMKLKLKTFVEVGPDGKEIATMLEATKAAEYHVDGLIFTPAETPVGGRYKSDDVKLKGRWNGALSGSPSHNSVDLVIQTLQQP
jgi:hypothetical protein